MTDGLQFSDQRDDKLRAALNHDGPDPDDALGAYYRQACAAWYAGLSERDKAIAALMAENYAIGFEGLAEQLASL